jgi:endoglucanase
MIPNWLRARLDWRVPPSQRCRRSGVVCHLSLILVLIVSLHGASARPAFGVYPLGQFHGQENTVEKRFIDWYPYLPGTVYNAIQIATQHHRQLLLTLQPMTNPLLGNDLLDDVTFGKYDDVIRQICREISFGRHSVIIRWGHEMEVRQARYPWSGRSPDKYIAAYRHVVLLMKALIRSPSVTYVWSPDGKPGSSEYWVGADVTNYIGFSVYSFYEYDVRKFGLPQSFQSLMNARNRIVAACNARSFPREIPVIVCEMGAAYSANHPEYQATWIDEAFAAMAHFPLLKIVVYFNSVDSVEWFPHHVPDFRIKGSQVIPYSN